MNRMSPREQGTSTLLIVFLLILLMSSSAYEFYQTRQYALIQSQMAEEKAQAFYLASSAEQKAILGLQQEPPIFQSQIFMVENGLYNYQATEKEPHLFDVWCRGRTSKGILFRIHLVLQYSKDQYKVLNREEY
ncbi:MAG: hypothetical protein AABZ60_13895 [Planctomycetota bacterium]